MSFLSRLLGEKKPTATLAKERLQIILAHERSGRNPQEILYRLVMLLLLLPLIY